MYSKPWSSSIRPTMGTVPETVAPAAGEVSTMVGPAMSTPASIGVDTTLPTESVARTRTIRVPTGRSPTSMDHPPSADSAIIQSTPSTEYSTVETPEPPSVTSPVTVPPEPPKKPGASTVIVGAVASMVVLVASEGVPMLSKPSRHSTTNQ
jgi:hypothetical protein